MPSVVLQDWAAGMSLVRSSHETLSRLRELATGHQHMTIDADRVASADDDACPVCLERHPVVCRVRKCGHEFCGDCLRRWCAQHATCPLCRGSVVRSAEPRTTMSRNDCARALRRHIRCRDTGGLLEDLALLASVR